MSKQRAQQGSAGKLEGVRPKQHVTMRRSRARGAREHPPSFPGAGASTCAKTPMASLREDTREKQLKLHRIRGGFLNVQTLVATWLSHWLWRGLGVQIRSARAGWMVGYWV